MDLNNIAKKILEQSQYMTIGSSNEAGEPWVSAVTYAYDKNYNFYFVSYTKSKHCLNIAKNKKVSLAIFDSHIPIPNGIGLQIEGVSRKLNPVESAKAMVIYFKRKYPYGGPKQTKTLGIALKKLLSNKTYAFYKITPTKIFINNPESTIDERIEVEI